MSAATTHAGLAGPKRDILVAGRMSRRRQRRNIVVKVLCVAATVIGLAVLASILFTLLRLGIGGLGVTVFTHMTKPSGDDGGLLNPIVGSLIQTALGAAIGTPIGIMVGTYLAEYARGSAFGNAVRFVSDVLLSAPSILIGLFVYQLFVNRRGSSGIAGALSLAVIVIPIVVRTTEDMLRLIPVSLREAAVALGAPKWKVDRADLLPCGAGRHRDRRAAGGRARRRRDGAAAVHQPRQRTGRST